MSYIWRTTTSDKALNAVLDEVSEWQLKGRSGYCMPVLRGALLEALEALADERRRDECNICGGSGVVDDFPCAHCPQLHDA